jgi:hypothetical protein
MSGKLFTYERRRQRPLSPARFARRLLSHMAVAIGLVAFSLGIGMWGYESFEHLAWRDAFLNSAMLLGGMGPVNNPLSSGGKLFAGCYALYCGLIFLLVAGLLLGPVVHRVLHRFHWEDEGRP